MKKFILISLSIILLCSIVWADSSPIKRFDNIPSELRGTWYSLEFSTDEGTTQDETYRPLIKASQFYLTTAYYSDRIIRSEMSNNMLGSSYVLFSEDEISFYMVVFYKEAPATPIVYMFKNGIEQYRACVKIVKI